MQGGNFLPDRYSRADAPALYRSGCANGVYPCTGTNRQAMNPLTGQFLGPNTAVNVGTLVPGTRAPTTTAACSTAGEGIVKDELHFPKHRRRAALRHGLRRDRQAAVRGARRRRRLLRSAPSRRPQILAGNTGRVRDRALCAIAELGHRRVVHAGRPDDHGVSSTTPSCPRRRRGTCGHADDAALGHVARRGLHRPSQLQRPVRRPGLPVQPQHDRPRNGVRPGAAGSDARADRHSGRVLARRAESQSGARISRLRHHRLAAVQ